MMIHINTGLHDQVRIATLLSMNKCKNQHVDTGTSVNINMGIYGDMLIPTWGIITKCDYQIQNI